MTVDHYSTLGVLPGASTSDLRSAYLKLARANHPDMFVGPERARAEAKMQQINEAWNVLGVPHKRREYDDTIPPEQKTRTASGASSAKRGREHFRAFHDDDPIDRSDVDFDDTPIAGSKAMPRWAAFVPIGLVLGGVLVTAFGTMVSGSGVVALGLISLGLGAVSFLMMPLVVMSRAERDPDL